MSDIENKEIEIDLNDSKPVEIDIEAGKVVETVEAKDEAAAAAPVVSADEGIESLKRQIAARDAENVRIAAEARASEDRAKRADAEIVDTRAQVIANAIDAVEREADGAERDFIAAVERGDATAQAKAQRAMAGAEAKLLRLREGKQALEAQRRQPPEATRQVSSDPVEAMASTLSPASASWVRRHPECATDRRMNSKMIAAHHDAVAEGIALDSPEYFAHIESHLGIGRKAPPTAQAEPPKPREQAPTAAPVSRESPHASGRSSSPTRVTLSSAEREICDMNGWDYVQYAKDKLALIKAGKLGA